jgi:hypothetical protein
VFRAGPPDDERRTGMDERRFDADERSTERR